MTQLTVGDNIILSSTDYVPADCVVYKCDEKFAVDERISTGERKPVKKKPLFHYYDVVLSRETIVFENSTIASGNAFALVLAVGDTTGEEFILRRGNRKGEVLSELREKHAIIFTMFLLAVIFISLVLLMQCVLFTNKIDWGHAGLVAGLLLVYGFPYMLAIPTVWQIALRNIVTTMNSGGKLRVMRPDSIEKAASLDYVCVQTIGLLD